MRFFIRISFTTLSLWAGIANAQVQGGRASMEFLRLANAPHIAALGGMNVSNFDGDIAFALQNPALMRPALHNQLGLNYNSYYANIGIMNLQYGYHVPTINTSFALGIQYLNYGSFTETDNIGNTYGDFKASDYALALAASRSYGAHWRYGATLKFAHSRLYDFASSALLTDVGVAYIDTASLVSLGITAKNMGFVLRRYNPANQAEPLPFDLQLGISKEFKHLPLRLFITLHHLYTWDIRYDNPADVVQNSLLGNTDTVEHNSHFGDKLFRHFIFGAELTLAKRLAITVAYNVQRRGEMVLQEKAALAGFSFGANLYLNKFQVHYARTFYSLAGAYNEFGLSMALHKIIATTYDKMHWKADYPDYK
jgi:hypothetical protein